MEASIIFVDCTSIQHLHGFDWETIAYNFSIRVTDWKNNIRNDLFGDITTLANSYTRTDMGCVARSSCNEFIIRDWACVYWATTWRAKEIRPFSPSSQQGWDCCLSYQTWGDLEYIWKEGKCYQQLLIGLRWQTGNARYRCTQYSRDSSAAISHSPAVVDDYGPLIINNCMWPAESRIV